MPLGIILTDHDSQPCSTLSNFENKSRPCCRRLRITTDHAPLNQLHCLSGIQNHASVTVLSNCFLKRSNKDWISLCYRKWNCIEFLINSQISLLAKTKQNSTSRPNSVSLKNNRWRSYWMKPHCQTASNWIPLSKSLPPSSKKSSDWFPTLFFGK